MPSKITPDLQNLIDRYKLPKADDLADEFPGLDVICRKVFGVPFSDATPNLREHVRIIAKRDAAEKMYQRIRYNLTYIPCTCVPSPDHKIDCPRGSFVDVIMEAEGRKLSGVKSVS